jgi:hypothetical protein
MVALEREMFHQGTDFIQVGLAMEPHPDLHMTDHSFPMIFVVVPTFLGGLIWLCAMLSRVPY